MLFLGLLAGVLWGGSAVSLYHLLFIKTKQYPIFLITEQLSFIIAPMYSEVETAWETGKYDTESKIAPKNVVEEIIKIPCRIVDILLKSPFLNVRIVVEQ